MQTWGKIYARRGCWYYTGKHWTGYPSEIYRLPSDLDMLVEYNSSRAISLNEKWGVDDAIKELSKSIFKRTGVYISATTYREVGEHIPIKEIVACGFIKIKKPLEKVA